MSPTRRCETFTPSSWSASFRMRRTFIATGGIAATGMPVLLLAAMLLSSCMDVVVKKRASTDRRRATRREADVLRRLTEVEELARANRRELELQFRRMAAMQVEIDALKKR